MAGQGVVRGVVRLAHPASNVYVVDGGEGLVLVDTGIAGRAPKIEAQIAALRALTGRDLSAIAITHAHADHAGSLARLAGAFPVPVIAGALDAAILRTGGAPPPSTPTSLLGSLLARIFPTTSIAASRVDIEAVDGTAIPGAPRLRAVATPGHTPGHVSYLWTEGGGVLFAGDSAANVLGLRESFVQADRAQARLSLRKLAEMDFAVAVFGHGLPIRGRAVAHFRRLVEGMAGGGAV